MAEIKPPKGFTLDAPTAVPEPPKGFALDAPEAEATAAPQSELSESVGAMDMVMQGLTFGFADEMASAVSGAAAGAGEAVGSLAGGEMPSKEAVVEAASRAYDRTLGGLRGGIEQYRQESPVAATAAEVGGGLATGGALAKGGATLLNAAKPTYASMAGRGAAEGAAYGGLYGAGTAEGGLEERGRGALTGAAFGGAAGGAVGVAGAGMAQKAASKAVPTAEGLREQAKAAYQAAKDAGVIVKPQSWGQTVDDIVGMAAREGVDPTIHPKASGAIKRLAESKGAPQSLDELDTLRRVLRGAASSNEPDERRIATMMIEQLDDYVGSLKPGDLMAGDASKAGKALREGRNLWRRVKKNEIIEDIFQRAELDAGQYSQSGMQNALVKNFRQLAKNKKMMRTFSEEERKMIRKVANGSLTINALRWLGKMAPRGPISGAFGAGMGMATGNPLVTAGMWSAGEAGRAGAGALTTRGARGVGEAMRAGGPVAPEQLSKIERFILESLIMGGAQQGTRAVSP